jgi:hypothetical protein
MKKVSIFIPFLFVFNFSHAQMEVGYNTTDIGAEFQWYKGGKFVGIHLAINSRLHHSFHGAIGYYFAGDPTASFYQNVNDGGLGLGLGYRYYTMLRPHGFFLGAKANLFTHEVSLVPPTPTSHNSLICIPALEAGYMILINDMLFITPSASIGYKTNLTAEMKAEEKKAVGLLGISAGIKF